MVQPNLPNILVIGSGLTGAVIARYAAETLNKKVLIFERRSHIGGNMYDFINDAGIRIQKYGPHIFHTSKPEIISYLNKFAKWNTCRVHFKISIHDKLVPNSPNYETIDTFFPEDADDIKKILEEIYSDKTEITFADLLECAHPLVKKYADFLYENDFRPYSAKQWAGFDTFLDRSVFARIPVHLNYSDDYWSDTYQIVPEKGFTYFISEILNHPSISLEFNRNACDSIKVDTEKKVIYFNGVETDALVIWTGAVDELLGYKYGRLPYRSLRFEYITKNIDSYQREAVIAYPLEKGFTRITEYKKLPVQDVPNRTTIAFEYPENFEGIDKNEPYYPIPSEETEKQYRKYAEDLKKIPNLILAGRLATYKYYNMDQALENAFSICDTIKELFK